jgi:hypothetical protein
LNTHIESQNVENSLSALALAAAEELDTEQPRSTSQTASLRLARELRALFPAAKGGRPNLPPETIGLVCGVVDGWVQPAPAMSGYKQSNEAAQEIAKCLESRTLSGAEVKRLVQFCLALYYATQSKSLIHDIPNANFLMI